MDYLISGILLVLIITVLVRLRRNEHRRQKSD